MIESHLAEFGRTMEDAGHDVSWAVSGVEVNGSPAKMFTFVTTHTETAEEAMRVLGAAGLLCETLLGQWGIPPLDEALSVRAMVDGLRALGGGR